MVQREYEVIAHGDSISNYHCTVTLTVPVPGESDPDIVVFGVVEVPDELHLGSAVDGGQLRLGCLAVVSGVWPGEALLTVVHKVAVAAVGGKERQTLPITRDGSWRRCLCECK